jgi:hypothetical protein
MQQNKKMWIIILVIVGVLVLCCALIGLFVLVTGGTAVGAALGLTQPAVDTGNEFMQALKDENYELAFDLCAPNIQEELGSAEGLQEFIEIADRQPEKWKFSSRSVENDVADLSGPATFRFGEATLTLQLTKIDDSWKVNTFGIDTDGNSD